MDLNKLSKISDSISDSVVGWDEFVDKVDGVSESITFQFNNHDVDYIINRDGTVEVHVDGELAVKSWSPIDYSNSDAAHVILEEFLS